MADYQPKGYHDVDSLFPEDPTPEELRAAVFDAAMAVLKSWREHSHLPPEDRLRPIAEAVDEMLIACVKAEEVERGV